MQYVFVSCRVRRPFACPPRAKRALHVDWDDHGSSTTTPPPPYPIIMMRCQSTLRPKPPRPGLLTKRHRRRRGWNARRALFICDGRLAHLGPVAISRGASTCPLRSAEPDRAITLTHCAQLPRRRYDQLPLLLQNSGNVRFALMPRWGVSTLDTEVEPHG